jgi:hypothetical protein
MIESRIAKLEAKGGNETKVAKLHERIAKVLDKQAATNEQKQSRADRKEIKKELSDVPVPPEFAARYQIDVTENIAVAGNHFTGFNNNNYKYRYVIKETATGRPLKVGYQYTYMSAYAAAERYVRKQFIAAGSGALVIR